MNKVPGFTAEASLYKAGEHCHMHTVATDVSTTQVLLQELVGPWTHLIDCIEKYAGACESNDAYCWMLEGCVYGFPTPRRRGPFPT